MGSNIGIEPGRGWLISSVQDDTLRDLGFIPTVIHDEYIVSPTLVDIISFDIFLEPDIAQGMIFNGKGRIIIHNFTIDVDPIYKYIENFRGCIQWCRMESKRLFFKYQVQTKK